MQTKELWFALDRESSNMGMKEKLKLQLWRCVDGLFFKTSLKMFSGWRVFLLRLFGAQIGKGCYIAPKATIYIPWNIKIGNYTSIDDYVYIKPRTSITIGDYVSISTFVHIIPGGHDLRTRNLKSSLSPILIKDGVFIGADSYIGGGVTIGQMAVIGARSLVMKDIPENTIAFGFPCIVRSERLPQEEYNKYRYNYRDEK
ncbi:MAG: hypothetical protein LBN29_12150 [Mediterranea sp.]|jgi:putative colanic acid biosynthesis acetyltransferase WcaF|nr:hypothetical protein [Mediterranea sp.]